MPTRLLFVCLGNICRSPTAEAVMRRLVRERGLEHEVEVDSAGTGDWHVGQPADERATAAARRRGTEISGSARQVAVDDFARADLLLAMDAANLRDLRRLAPPGTEHTVRLLTDVDVPDPYFGGEDGFDTVLDLVEDACARLLDEVTASGGGGTARGDVRQG